MEELINKIIYSVWIDHSEQHEMFFETNMGDIAYLAVGDCCSESWFYHVLGADVLINARVLDVKEIPMGQADDGYSRQDSDQLYCIKITTDKGMADIEFRNSSNGYYGGWIEEIDPNLVSKKFMVRVDKDYTANTLYNNESDPIQMGL